MYKIVMVDDHAMVRTGLRAILEEEIPGVEVQEAGTAHEGLNLLRGYDADAVILDLGLPDRSGLDVLKRIHHEWPRLPVLVLSMYSEDQYGLRVMRAEHVGRPPVGVPEGGLVLLVLPEFRNVRPVFDSRLARPEVHALLVAVVHPGEARPVARTAIPALVSAHHLPRQRRGVHSIRFAEASAAKHGQHHD